MLRTIVPFLACIALFACGGDDPGPASPAPTPAPPGELVKAAVARDTSEPPAADLATTVRDNTAFAFDLHRALVAESPSANLFFSPLSVQLAFAMTLAGSRGSTESEIRSTFGWTVDPAGLHRTLNALDRALAARNGVTRLPEGAEAPELSLVNSLWTQQGTPFEEPFLNLLAREYDAGMWVVDFIGDAESSRQAINAWVEEATRNRIVDLLPDGSLSDLTRLVLVNALYFKASWETPLAAAATADAPFANLDGTTAQVPMMALEGTLHTATLGDVLAVELPYAGNELSMVLLQPLSGDFATLEQTLDAALWSALTNALAPAGVQLALPRFTFRSELDLVPTLRGMGMDAPFGSADFSGISQRALPEGWLITGVFHQAFVAVDEKGTEAAAATAVVIGRESAPVLDLTVRFDRPFVLAIRDRVTGTLLFQGRVVQLP
jgi:serpin B